MPYLTRSLAEHVLSVSAIPHPGLTETVKRCVLDLLGAAIAGSGMPAPTATRAIARTVFGCGDAAIWLTKETAAPGAALLCNSAAASALDLDDGNRAARGHPGACVIPTALTLAPGIAADAHEVVAAIIAGYDVGVRIAAAQTTEGIRTRQSGRWAAFAAAAVAGRLLRLKPEELSHALAISGVLAPNQLANGSSGYSRLTGNDVKEGIPWSSAAGVAAAYLAGSGHTGPEDILDHSDYYDRARIVNALATHWEITDTYFKPYACCRYIHPALDALRALMAAEAVDSSDILEVEVQTFAWALKLANSLAPAGLVDLQYSLPYCIAIAAIDGPSALAPPAASCLNRKDLQEFAGKIRLTVDASLDRCFPAETLARVIVRTGRREFHSAVHSPVGDPKRPMEWRAIVDKFRTVTGNRVSPEQQQQIIDGVSSLFAGNLTPLIRSLQLQPRG